MNLINPDEVETIVVFIVVMVLVFGTPLAGWAFGFGLWLRKRYDRWKDQR